MPVEMGQQMCHAPLLVLDGKKPAKRIFWPEFRHLGAVITGVRSGLEAWAREMAEHHRRPLIVIKVTPDVERVSGLVAHSALICPLEEREKELGKLRSELLRHVGI
jgi:hypothetical protein